MKSSYDCNFRKLTRRTAALAVAVSALMPLAAMASTVAYWPLAGENGVRTTASDVFQNIANPGTLDAVPVWIKTSSGEVNATTSVNYCPIGTHAFPAAFGVYDPVAGVNHPSATGVDFDSRYFSNNWNTSSNATIPLNSCWWKGAFRVADPDALKLSTFTVEFFARPDPAMKGYYQFIAAMPLGVESGKTMAKESWSIVFDNSGRMYTAFTVGGTRKSYSPSTMPNVFDGRWHHLAITVSGTAVKMYADYMLIGTATLDGDIQYLEDGDLFIGASTHHCYSYHGSMAHFRVSDEALTSDKFLHFTRTVRAENEADDVVLHLDFEPVDGLSTNKTVVFNRAATGSAVHLHTSDNATYAGYATVDADVYTNKLYASRKDFKGSDNLQSYSKTSNNTKYPYLAWYPGEDIFHDNSFTIEMFLKTATKNTWIPYLRRRVDPVATGGVQVTMGTGGTAGQLSCGFESPVRVYGTVLINEWQHLALVYDRTAGSFSLFQNWSQLGSNTMSASSIGTASDTPITLFGDAGNDPTSFIGKIDEVRITKRALTNKEFLTPDKAKGLIIMFH